MKYTSSIQRVRVLLFTIVMLGIVALPTVISIIVSNTTAEELASIASLPLMFITVHLFLRWEGESSFASVGLRSNGNRTYPLVVGGIAGACAALFVFIVAIILGGTVNTIDSISSDMLTGVVILTIFVAVLEELCYRGYLMTRIADVWNVRWAVLMSSVIFSIAHFNWWIPWGTVSGELALMFSINIFVGGIVLGLSYYLAGKNLLVPISFHYAWNIIAYLLFPIFPTTTDVVNPLLFQIEWGVTTIPGLLLGLLLVRLLLLKVDTQK